MRTKTIVAVAGALTLLMGCVNNGALLRDGVPAGTLNLVNASGGTLTVVTISECSVVSQSASRLDSGEVVGPGESRRWAVSEGCYDVQAGFPITGGYTSSDSRIQIAAERIYNLTVR